MRNASLILAVSGEVQITSTAGARHDNPCNRP
jgi:hypothetical protein